MVARSRTSEAADVMRAAATEVTGAIIPVEEKT
jgi:hypothetical protein